MTKEKRPTTRNIRKPGDVCKLNFCTFTKIYNGLTSWSFEIPASAYCHRWRSLTKRAEDRNYNNFEWNIKSD